MDSIFEALETLDRKVVRKWALISWMKLVWVIEYEYEYDHRDGILMVIMIKSWCHWGEKSWLLSSESFGCDDYICQIYSVIMIFSFRSTWKCNNKECSEGLKSDQKCDCKVSHVLWIWINCTDSIKSSKLCVISQNQLKNTATNALK